MESNAERETWTWGKLVVIGPVHVVQAVQVTFISDTSTIAERRE